jgi:hypothetical protein
MIKGKNFNFYFSHILQCFKIYVFTFSTWKNTQTAYRRRTSNAMLPQILSSVVYEIYLQGSEVGNKIY